MKRKWLVFAVTVEVLGIMVVSAGLGAELALGGAIYLAVITGGSVLVAAGGIIFAKFLRR